MSARRAIAFVCAWGASCGSDQDDTTEADACEDPALTWEGFAQPFFATWCTSCHGSDLTDLERHGAPAELNFDTLEGVTPYASLIQSAAVDSYRMPPTNAVGDEDRARLGDWIACGLPGTDLPPPTLEFCDAPRLHTGDVVTSALPPGACTEWDAVTGDLVVDDAASPLVDCLCEVQGRLSVTAAGEVTLASLVRVGQDLRVRGTAGITHFAVPALVTVTGSVVVTDEPFLSRLDLTRLEVVGGDLSVYGLPALVEFPTMHALNEVDGTVELLDLDALTFLDVAPRATTLEGPIHVVGHARVESLWIAEFLSRTPPEILVADNAVLRNVVGLDNITEVGDLAFVALPALEALPELGALTTAHSISVIDTTALTTLGGVGGVREVTGAVTIDANASLVDVTSLGNIESVGGNFTVTNNPVLPSAAVDALLAQIGIENVEGTIDVSGNGP